MAQYGDSHNPSTPRFQRYSSPAQSSANGYQSPADRAETSLPGQAQPPYSSGQASANGNSQNTEPDRTTGFSSYPSGSARRRNQWRQHQQLTPDFGLQPPVAPDTQPSEPSLSREASLPKLQPLPSPATEAGKPVSRSAPSSSRPAIPRDRSSPLRQPPAPQTPASVRKPHPKAASSRSRTTNSPPLQAHPHSTFASPQLEAMAPTTPRPTPGRPVPRNASQPVNGAAQVTPLRPRSRRRPLGGNSAPADGAGAYSQPLPPEPRSRSQRGLQRRLAKPPLPVLYLIRLMILGVGVAAIAGTLLSVLSPSNVVSSSQEPTSTTAARPSRAATSGALLKSSGNGPVSVEDLALTSELTRLKAQIEQLATLTPGLTQSVFAVDLDAGRYVDLEGSIAVPAASTIKVPILIAFLQQVDAGNIALNQALTLEESQVAGGSGTMQSDAVGTQYTALEVATRMIVTSDNTATNMIVDALGGPTVLNQVFEEWGLQSTVLRNPLPDLEGTNTTSVRDLSLLMALVDQGALISSRSRDRLFGIMQRTVNRALIPFAITDDSIVANKTGDLATTLGDVALVDAPNGKRYVLAVLVQRPDNDGRANELIRRVAETTHTELSQPIAPVGGGQTSNIEVQMTPAGEAVPVPDYPGLEVEPVPTDGMDSGMPEPDGMDSGMPEPDVPDAEMSPAPGNIPEG